MFNVIRGMKRGAVKVMVGVTVVAAFQGYQLRRKYTQLNAPVGPYSGSEKWIENVKKEIKRQSDGAGLLSLFRKRTPIETVSPSNSNSGRRRIKLVLLGDSLVCGIGATELVLPRVIARSLSQALQADVSWTAQGINGGTSEQLRDLIQNPEVAADFTSSEEVFVVVICGLNDWKTILLQFPFGTGPVKFKNNLDHLLGDIRRLCQGQCRVFLPALPMVCLESDPSSSVHIKPLKYFVDFMVRTWDRQKKNLADDSCIENLKVTYIEEPDVNAVFATPGYGNVSEDGVHPSSQGYKWWGLHIVDSMLRSLKTNM